MAPLPGHKGVLFMNITIIKHDGVKCPRCYRYTGEGRFNFDGLCDRCCDVLVQDYPEHEATVALKAHGRWI